MFILTKEFQYTDSTHAITILPAGTRFEQEVDGQLHFTINRKRFALDKQVALANPQFFKQVDFRTRLTELLKAEKATRTAPKLAELVHELVETELLRGNVLVPTVTLDLMVDACYHQYLRTADPADLIPLKDLGYTWDDKGYYAPM